MEWVSVFSFALFSVMAILGALFEFLSAQAWSFVLAAFGILGIYLAGSKNLWGWVISFTMQALWITYAIVTEQYGFIFSSLGYAWVYGRNYLKWRKEQKEESV